MTRSSTTKPRYCVACGATEGTPHHDPGAHGRTTTITRSSAGNLTFGETGKRDLCMLCLSGRRSLDRDKRHAAACFSDKFEANPGSTPWSA